MKSISRKKGGEGEAKYPNALIMSLFKDEDIKKTIRASVSAADVIELVLPARDTVNQALSAPYVAPRRQVNMSSSLLRSLNLTKRKNSGA
eukprot:12535303-Ditylum_brightwellii.AAC.1